MEHRIELLFSCMGVKDYRILEMANVRSDALIVDQCDENCYEQTTYRGFAIRHLKCTERGLSRSRNRAIEYAQGDIGLICDDDEWLVDEYPSIISQAYDELPDADLICFRIGNRPRRLRPVTHRIRKISALSIGSWQISMNIAAVRASGVRFDELMGAGSGNGAGEEAKFIADCLDAGLKVYYVPSDIGTVGTYQLESAKGGESTWFRGFDKNYFYQRGSAVRYIMGLPFSLFYSVYYPVTHRKAFGGSIAISQAVLQTLRGAMANPIGKQAAAQSRSCNRR